MQKLEWRTEQRTIADLIPYDKNPRKIKPADVQRLTDSLNKFNVVDIPAIDADGTLIGWHQRAKIMIALGRGSEQIDVRIPNRKLTDAEFKELNLRQNILNGEFLPELLEETLPDLSLLAEIGMPKNVISDIAFNKTDKKESENYKYEHKNIVTIGDIFEINGHRIMCADSTVADNCTALMNGAQAAMVFTDPPYNVEISDVIGNGTTDYPDFSAGTGEMNDDDFTQFLYKILQNLAKSSLSGAIFYICMDWRHTFNVVAAARKIEGLEHKQQLTWIKDNAGMGTFYRSGTENILCYKNGKEMLFLEGQETFQVFKNDKKSKHQNNFELGQFGRYRSNVLHYANVNSFVHGNEKNLLKLHPTVKPTELIADLIIDVTLPKQIVLDLFSGSGSTLIAAEQTHRLCYTMELSEKYCETSVTRLLQFLISNNTTVDFKHINGALTHKHFL